MTESEELDLIIKLLKELFPNLTTAGIIDKARKILESLNEDNDD